MLYRIHGMLAVRYITGRGRLTLFWLLVVRWLMDMKEGALHQLCTWKIEQKKRRHAG